MGALSCFHCDCNNIMCSRYSYTYGYICNECFEELVSSNLDIDEFMNTPKQTNFFAPIERREEMEKEFKEDD